MNSFLKEFALLARRVILKGCFGGKYHLISRAGTFFFKVCVCFHLYATKVCALSAHTS